MKHAGSFAAGVLGSLISVLINDKVTSAPCASGVTAINVTTRDDAQNLSDALECTGGGGVFDVTWYGNVTVSQTIAVRDGSTVTVSGATSPPDGAAVVDGAEEARLFFVNGASTLNLHNLVLQGGWHNANGSAVYAEAQSTVKMFNCEFTDNTAHHEGGDENV